MLNHRKNRNKTETPLVPHNPHIFLTLRLPFLEFEPRPLRLHSHHEFELDR